ncbi:peptidoglycan-binding protein [Streptomyces sp. MBT60]|uniref:peptidoglycan-binding protein n=1 Tax=Streptomyces sp. MBT60 TaxID=2800409 RepID=UPI00190C3BE0|nr:peptidoglycan-binding protein [Streptomyces sp. MBT60]MBK3547526.1 peptidoglycan-binding protein [Streptomyces sp. MBT60]
MSVPVFEEYEPAIDCGCAGCAVRRRSAARALPVRRGGHPAAHGARRALVLATAAGVVLSCGAAGAAAAAGHAPGVPRADDGADPEPSAAHPQGEKGPLRGTGASGPPSAGAAAPKTTRAAIIDRAQRWVNAKVPYSMEKYWSDGYRQDCSGYVSMAWNLGTNEWTGSLAAYGTRIARADLQPGDILLFHNPADPAKGSHVTIFGGWANSARTQYVAYEQARPRTRKQSTPLAYWNNSDRYVAYRYKGVTGGSPGAGSSTAFPGAKQFGTGGSPNTAVAFPGRGYFKPGQSNSHVDRLGKQLVKKGYGKHYASGPSPLWTEADRRNVEAFQRAQGWRGGAADGYPGPETWRRLFA